MTHTAAPSSSLLTRRALITGAAGLALAGCTTGTARRPAPVVAGPSAIDPYYLAMYAAMPQEKFPIPAVDLRKLDPVYFRQVVDYPTQERPGTLVVDTPNRFLYLVMENGQALRYGVGIGRAGFSWGGNGVIKWKQEWPKWFPPAEMIERDPKLKEYSEANGGMPAGLMNPLGARALYIFENGKDTLYRVHGNPDWTSIGKAVSSGCIRMLNQDVIDLYNRVNNLPAPIVVYQ